MNYAKILRCDTANGPGMRITLFVSGCRRKCKGCFNREAWDFCAGKPFARDTESRIIDLLENPYIQGLTVLGGEPLEPENRGVLLPFLLRVRRRFGQEKDIWIYSGYCFEDLVRERKSRILLSAADVLVDGPFIEEEKDISLLFRGSRNQRILSMPKSLENRTPVWAEEYQE